MDPLVRMGSVFGEDEHYAPIPEDCILYQDDDRVRDVGGYEQPELLRIGTPHEDAGQGMRFFDRYVACMRGKYLTEGERLFADFYEAVSAHMRVAHPELTILLRADLFCYCGNGGFLLELVFPDGMGTGYMIKEFGHKVCTRALGRPPERLSDCVGYDSIGTGQTTDLKGDLRFQLERPDGTLSPIRKLSLDANDYFEARLLVLSASGYEIRPLAPQADPAVPSLPILPELDDGGLLPDEG